MMSTSRPTHGDLFESKLTIRALRALNVVFARCWHRVELLTPCTLPQRGPAILVCNHVSSLDPALLQSCTKRHIRWMMAAEYLSIRPLRPFFETIGVIPVARGTRDAASTRAALRALANGEIIGVFPEGRIARTRHLLPFHPGAAVLASRTGVPVVPAAIDGTMRDQGVFSGFIIPSTARLCFGIPLRCSSRMEPEGDATRTMTSEIEQSVRVLFDSLRDSKESLSRI